MNEHLHIQALTTQRDRLAREVTQLRAEVRELKAALYGHALTDDELDTFLTQQDARAMAAALAEPATAAQASKREQIAVANRLSSGGDWLQPWPVCGKRAASVLGMRFP